MRHADATTIDGAGAGVLPDVALRAAVEAGWITASTPLGDEQFQPASLDLRLGPLAYQLRASFLPFRETVQGRLDCDTDLECVGNTNVGCPGDTIVGCPGDTDMGCPGDTNVGCTRPTDAATNCCAETDDTCASCWSDCHLCG